MPRRYVTVDVFTEHRFGGNPLAVVLDADGLSAEAMQKIAAEFNYSETTFVLPAGNPRHTARVRIFTPRSEVPFAGHPNVGTACVLAWERGADPGDEFLFEERAGLVPVRLLSDGGAIVGAEIAAPERLSRRSRIPAEIIARCLTLEACDIRIVNHAPQVISVGLPFVVAELESRDALRRARPDLAAHEQLLPLDGADGIYAYWREQAADCATPVLHARMFAPIDGVFEDPATGSATAATVALLAELEESAGEAVAWQIHQGADMGRPSRMAGRTKKSGGVVVDVHVGGRCIAVMSGQLRT